MTDDPGWAAWMAVLYDRQPLLNAPGARHKLLIKEAYAMVSAGTIHPDLLCDMLEMADAALEWAFQELIEWESDQPADAHAGPRASLGAQPCSSIK
ncbi:hypothetical protein M2401_006205 [Pseudomonas sp. JUb42]|uniref:hypothetical protein n=1 Tax=Pseudomonas sp. JUb42 TaxID=2940611 RepID=UPI002168C7E9|nr:hypothetical protein [Pseudomonas sp. JUb42]MCS3472441.1 hypothetical protein [Pseudomonas sp. JUb42]